MGSTGRFTTADFLPFTLFTTRARQLRVLQAMRWHGVNIFVGGLLTFAPLAVLGASPEVFCWAAAINGVTGITQHANVRMRTPRWLDVWLCTPKMHRFHHSAAKQFRDANYGTIVMLFDHLWGTYKHPGADVPERFGIADDASPAGFWKQVTWPLRAQWPRTPRPVNRTP